LEKVIFTEKKYESLATIGIRPSSQKDFQIPTRFFALIAISEGNGMTAFVHIRRMMYRKTLWLSGPKATFRVDVDENGWIIKAAPIAWRWKGQHMDDLIRYFNIEKIEEI
jgi:hypothetical protein